MNDLVVFSTFFNLSLIWFFLFSFALAVQQSKSALCILLSPVYWASSHSHLPHSTFLGTLAWKIPWMEEPGGLLSLGSHRVGHAWSDLAVAAGHRRAPSWVPCAIQLLPTSYLFYTPFPPLPCPLIHNLRLHLCSCPENRLIYTIFLESIHMH